MVSRLFLSVHICILYLSAAHLPSLPPNVSHEWAEFRAHLEPGCVQRHFAYSVCSERAWRSQAASVLRKRFAQGVPLCALWLKKNNKKNKTNQLATCTWNRNPKPPRSPHLLETWVSFDFVPYFLRFSARAAYDTPNPCQSCTEFASSEIPYSEYPPYIRVTQDG